METESKFTLPTAEVFEQWLALTTLGDCALRPRPTEIVTDHYYDTADGAFAQGGYACRLREGGGRWLATLKGRRATSDDPAIHQREEYEVEIAAQASPAAWPASPARDFALKIAGSGELRELFTLRQERHIRHIKRGRQHLATLSLDVVTVGECVWWELEIELTPRGARTDLQRWNALLAEWPARPEPTSKFERALKTCHVRAPTDDASSPTERAPDRSQKIIADDTLITAGRKILARQFAKMQAKENGARAGADPEDLHAMRVATRRQRAALRLLKPYFRAKAARPIRRGLRDLAGFLGAVRDLDVLLDTARAETAPAPLLAAWAAQREAARAALLAHLDSADYAAWRKAYARFLRAPEADLAPDPAHLPRVCEALPAALWAHYGAVRAYENHFAGADVATLHALRIKGKYLRYLLEFFADVLGDAAARAISPLTALQDHLGHLHDADVRLGLIRAYLDSGDRPPLTRDQHRAIEHYAARTQRALHRLHRTATRPWRPIIAPRFRRRVGKMAAGV